MNDLIDFIYTPIAKEKNTGQKPREYPEILKNEGSFQIEVNGKLYFDEPNFSVDEFLLYADRWIVNGDKSQSMHYHCVDTDENPLISFSMKNGRWYIDSPWKLFECNDSFARDELEKAVIRLEKDINS